MVFLILKFRQPYFIIQSSSMIVSFRHQTSHELLYFSCILQVIASYFLANMLVLYLQILRIKTKFAFNYILRQILCGNP